MRKFLQTLQCYLQPRHKKFRMMELPDNAHAFRMFINIMRTVAWTGTKLDVKNTDLNLLCIDEWTYFSHNKFRYLCAQILRVDENMMPYWRDVDWGMAFAELPHKDFFRLILESENTQSGAGVPKKKFCAFLYWNWRCTTRNRLYELLSRYRRVDALGSALRNTHSRLYRFAEPRDANAVNAYLPYKFVLSVENSFGLHYTTEKILNAYQAGAVPIYWGSPDIAQIYNPDSFINAYDFESLESLARYIIKVDNDDTLYARYREAPMQSAQQYARWHSQYDEGMKAFCARVYRRASRSYFLPAAQRQNLRKEFLSRVNTRTFVHRLFAYPVARGMIPARYLTGPQTRYAPQRCWPWRHGKSQHALER